ncbi:MAG: formylglycine-generating enzyme family protein [Candidatus Electrothrix sp. AX5]|nr:formylglycine-generating enzyme family protein [Candidatus Electrothrix sp. AX5]
MEFVFIPKGCFFMGQDVEDKQQIIAEVQQRVYDKYFKGGLPQHEVCVNGFWMGRYEVTQAQWQKIMGRNPARFKKGDSYPVEQVSWEDVQKFIVQLNKKSGRNYRLPTEAEWEYAGRAESSYKYSGSDILDAVAWYQGNSYGSTHPVGKKKVNAFGLYDMSGNVWEWCSDRYNEGYYAYSPKNNPSGPASGRERVIRGGSWILDSVFCRVVHRNSNHPENSGDLIGFRLVLPF